MKHDMDPRHIRNFCIIAHIDHGKSALASAKADMNALNRLIAARQRG